MLHFDSSDGSLIKRDGEAFVKRPSPTYLIQVGEGFEVTTDSGIMALQPNSWLCYDEASGHVWGITDEYKNMHYVKAEA